MFDPFPFMRGIVKRFAQANQARCAKERRLGQPPKFRPRRLGSRRSLVASLAHARILVIDVVLQGATEAKLKFYPLTAESGGYFSGAANAGSGACYRFRVNGAENFYPDPASRFQPDGPHG